MNQDAGSGRPCKPLPIIDPFPKLHALRNQEGPVAAVDLRAHFGLPPHGIYGPVKEVAALSFDAVREILMDQARFSTNPTRIQQDLKLGALTIMGMDDPEHRQHRNLVSAGFFAKAVEQWASAVVPEIIDTLLDSLEPYVGTPVDLYRTVIAPLPIQVISSVVGVPRTDWPEFLGWIDAFVNGMDNPALALAGGKNIQRYLTELVAVRRRQPTEDLASQLIKAEIDGQALSDSAIVAFLGILLVAGGETTVRGIGTTLTALLSDADQEGLVREDPYRLAAAMDEGLRWNTPVQITRREARETVSVAGTCIEKGTHISVHLGVANRDPSRWNEPDRFDLRRPSKPSVSFGAGAHYCLGVNLARLEILTTLNSMFRRLENLRLAPDMEAPRITGFELRGPEQINAIFDSLQPRSKP